MGTVFFGLKSFCFFFCNVYFCGHNFFLPCSRTHLCVSFVWEKAFLSAAQTNHWNRCCECVRLNLSIGPICNCCNGQAVPVWGQWHISLGIGIGIIGPRGLLQYTLQANESFSLMCWYTNCSPFVFNFSLMGPSMLINSKRGRYHPQHSFLSLSTTTSYADTWMYLQCTCICWASLLLDSFAHHVCGIKSRGCGMSCHLNNDIYL